MQPRPSRSRRRSGRPRGRVASIAFSVALKSPGVTTKSGLARLTIAKSYLPRGSPSRDPRDARRAHTPLLVVMSRLSADGTSSGSSPSNGCSRRVEKIGHVRVLLGLGRCGTASCPVREDLSHRVTSCEGNATRRWVGPPVVGQCHERRSFNTRVRLNRRVRLSRAPRQLTRAVGRK